MTHFVDIVTARIKRNTVEYDCAGAATRKDAQELIEFTRELRGAVIAWLEREHIELILPEDHPWPSRRNASRCRRR